MPLVSRQIRRKLPATFSEHNWPGVFCRVNFFVSASRHGNSTVSFRFKRKRYCYGIHHKRSP